MRDYEVKPRLWVHKTYPSVPCWNCARATGFGERACNCRDDYGNMMNVPYESEHPSCMFVWEVELAAQEAKDRLAHIGYDALPPMVKDVYRILDDALDYRRKQLWKINKESEASNG